MTEQTNINFDVVIVGSGPAGVSAAFPLVEAGLQVLMVDGGQDTRLAPPAGQFLEIRRHDANQWKWMIGRDFHALREVGAVSPKLRVPVHASVFQGFQAENHILADGFVAVGSLAPGGLSNAWGCGVACLTDEELARFPVAPVEMRTSYAAVARRIGISGGHDDDLSDFFGLDEWSQLQVPMDELQRGLYARYVTGRKKLNQKGFRLGNSRVAVLTEPIKDRQACDRSGNCLWGCDRRALYSATEDLRLLQAHKTFHYRSGFIVKRIIHHSTSVAIEGRGTNGNEVVRARRVLLAAGTLASTRLALQAINHRSPVAVQSCPTAAFMLWMPRHLGRVRDAAFGLGHLSFVQKFADGMQSFGALLNITGIPVTEFACHLPFGKRYSVDLLESLLSSCLVGNLFLPGEMTDATLCLDKNDNLVVQGKYRDVVTTQMRKAHRLLRANFWQLGAILMPASFKIGDPGSDIHYAASLPMCANPEYGQTDSYGELSGAAGLHVVDGAILSSLPAKSHTLTIMANADRIARHLTSVLSGINP